MDWEVFVDAGESCNKMIFERLDCTFRRFSSVQLEWNELEAFIFFCHEFLQDCWALVAEIVHFRCYPAFGEYVVDCGVIF